MKRLFLAVLAVSIGAASTAALATDDPILTRKKLMDANGAAMGAAQGMVKGEIPFDPRIAQAALQSFNSVAYSFGDYFPEGSDKGDTSASPAIWENMAEFQEHLTDFQADTEAAAKAKPQDLESFKTALGPIGEDCGGCHEEFRLKKN